MSNVVLLLVSLLCVRVAAQARQFFKPMPRPLAVKYVTTNAEEGTKKRTGDKATPFSVEDLADATLFPEPVPGTVFLLAGGLYRLGQVLTLTASLSGNATNPVVVMANPGDRVTFEGKLAIAGNHIWLIGVEVTDPMNLDKGAAAIALRGSHSRVINCFVHDTATGHGIVAPTGAEGQVVYGNIVSRTGIASARPDEEPTDGIRVGNAASFGAKYVADNMLIGFNALCDKCRGLGVHANPTTAAAFAVDRASAVVVEGNIFDRSQATIGGSGAPAEQNVVNENWFAASELQVGQASPTQTEVTGNVIAWSYLDSRYIWVDGDAAYGAPAKPTVIRGNSVFFAPVDGDLGRMDDLPVLDLGTAAYVSAADKDKVGARPVLGNAPLPGSLQVDQNTFGGNSTFFRLGAGGVKDSAQTIEAWRTLTGNAGKAVDASSSVVAPPTATLVVTRKNLYSPYLQYVVVFNYGNATNATVPLREFATIMSPMKFAVYKASDLWGKPTAEGTLPSTSVDVPLEPNALTASFVVVANGGVDPTFPPKCLDRNSPECEACPRFDEGCLDGPCRAGNTCLTTSLVCNKNICEDPPTAKQMDGGAHQSTLSVWLIVMIISALTTSI